ncbi:MAG: pyruvate formate lyase family protein, partial [Myxococcota bacterium]
MAATARASTATLKQPHGLSPRIRFLRDYYFQGCEREWNNEFTCWTTGEPWDVVYDEISFHIVPETYAFFPHFRASTLQAAHRVQTPPGFYQQSIAERRAWFIREVMVGHVPQEILPGDLLAGGRFNILASRCWTRGEARERDRLVLGKDGARARVIEFHEHGYGNAGATSGHLIPDYRRVLEIGFKGIYRDLEQHYDRLSSRERRGPRGAQLRAMMPTATMPRDLAARYAALCRKLAAVEKDQDRRDELSTMAAQLVRVPWEPAETFWEAVQALWMAHMLVMSDENYPGPGVSFGRIDQYLLPYWRRSIEAGMDPELGKEILRCFFVHANTAYDAMIRVGGNQGITAGFGQLLTLSGMGKGGEDLTNELTYAFLDVIDEMSPILEPKPNVRLHRGSPEELLDRLVDMISRSQGAPFLLNFD